MLPVAIREHLLSGPGGAEHRTIAVAFVQFSGTDALLARRGPEVTAGALDDCIRNVSAGRRRARRDVLRDRHQPPTAARSCSPRARPRTAGHDEERMLRAARQIVERTGRLPLRIGVNRGRVFSGDFGPPFRRTYSVKGDAINLAARVMGKAAPGQLLATRAVIDHAETSVRDDACRPVHGQGQGRPVAAVAIGAITGGRRRRERRENPLVGRDQEMAVLREALDAARAGRGGVVELVGEPGIGKSRLVEELAAIGRDADVHSIGVRRVRVGDAVRRVPRPLARAVRRR